MTKRFTGEFDKQYSGVYDEGEQLTNFEVVDLLNALHEENKKLRMSPRVESIEIEEIVCENQRLKNLIKTVLETTPIEHSLALDLKNSIREMYE
jgi:hypothetical protein